MLHGEVLYRDIFQFNLPGMEFLYLFFLRCFGVRLWVPDAMLLVAGTAITLLVYALARRVLTGAAALLPALAFLVVCQRSSLDGSHHWYSTLFVLLAINIVARTQRLAWIAVAGALLGVATLITSSRGAFVAAGVALFFVWSCRGWRDALRPIAALLAPFFGVVVATLAYLDMQVGGKVLFESLLVFPLRYYGAGEANSVSVYFDEWHSFLPLRPYSLLLATLWFAVNFATPVLLIGFAGRLIGKKNESPRDSQHVRTLVLFVFAGGFALLGVAGAPAAPRLNCAACFAYVLGAVLLEECRARRVVAGLLAMVCLMGVAEAAAAVARPVYVFSGWRGEAALLNQDDYEYMMWLGRNARPGDGYFGGPMVNWIVGVRNPAAIEWAEPDAYTRPEQVRALIAVLEREQTRFIDPVDDAVEPRNADDSLEPLRVYLKTHYHVGHTFVDGGTVLERNNVNAKAAR